MQWKKLWSKTFHSPFFCNRPAWVKGFWAVLIAESDDEGCTSCEWTAMVLRGRCARPAMGEIAHCVADAMDMGMLEIIEKNGLKYYKLKGWEKYQKSPKPTEREMRKKDFILERRKTAHQKEIASSPAQKELTAEQINQLRLAGKYVTPDEIKRVNGNGRFKYVRREAE